MTISQKGSYRISTAPTKIPIIFFIEIEETILKSYRGNKGPPKNKSNPQQKEQYWKYQYLISKYTRATVRKATYTSKNLACRLRE